METLYRYDPLIPGGQSTFGSPCLQPVKGLTESAAMTAMCLMDALCDFEHSAVHRRDLREGGQETPPNPNADLGDLIGELRSEQGSFQTRQDVLDMVATVDAAWDRVNADDACDGAICFDFEFCPEAIRLHFERDLIGDDLEDALVQWGRDAIAAADARWAAIRAGLGRVGAVVAAQNALSQAQASVEAATRHLAALTAS